MLGTQKQTEPREIPAPKSILSSNLCERVEGGVGSKSQQSAHQLEQVTIISSSSRASSRKGVQNVYEFAEATITKCPHLAGFHNSILLSESSGDY